MAIELLIVEDEYAERQELAKLMEQITPPEHIRYAASCDAAIQMITEQCPELILLDMMLRGRSGFEVAQFVRDNALSCRIVILTAYNEFEFASKALSMGVQDYLLKPVRPADLLRRVRQVLRGGGQSAGGEPLPLWPYLSCGVWETLPPFPGRLPNLVVAGLLRVSLPAEEWWRRLAQVNLELREVGWSEGHGQRLIGYCRSEPAEEDDAVGRIVDVWRSAFPELACAERGSTAASAAALPESYRTACRRAESRMMFPADAPAAREVPYGLYPVRQEDHLLTALRSGSGDLESCCRQMCAALLQASGRDLPRLRQYLSLLQAAMARLCLERARRLPPAWEIEGALTPWQVAELVEAGARQAAACLHAPTPALHPMVQATLAVSERGYRAPLKLETIAREQFVNPAYLGRLFHSQTGKSFRDALTAVRMEHAERLLAEKRPIAQVAEAVGYDDPNYFSRVYKKHFGHPPKTERGGQP